MSKALYIPLQLFFGTALCLSANPLLAQVTSDSTVNTQVTQNGNVAEITGGETRGSNLFHSFQDFSVQTGNEAFFNNADSISNIFSRVTGGNISNIDGAIGANGSASLFLINPAGIIFGENSSLNIGGSFYGSTASSVLFEDGEFSAVDNLEQPILAVNAPIGLGFRDNPGDIINRAATGNRLEIFPGETIALVGGNVTFDGGGIFAPGANVKIGGLTEAGEISIAEDSTLSFPDGVARGNVLLTNVSNVIVTGVGGSIFINSNNLELNSSSSLIAGINSDPSFPDAQAGDIVINAIEDVLVDGTNDIEQAEETSPNVSSIVNSVFEEGIGNAGNIEITARNISTIGSDSIVGSGIIQSIVEGQGDGSQIRLTATENISFQGFRSGTRMSINSSGIGNGGDINFSAQNLFVLNSAQVTNRISGIGNSGNINIDVDDTVSITSGSITNPSIVDSTNLSDGGNSGNINIKAKNIVVTDGAELTTLSFFDGNIGDIDIKAEESISVGDFATIQAESDSGNAGNVDIETNQLLLFDRGQISTSSTGSGNAGNVNISASLVELKNRSFIDAFPFGSTNLGQGGSININSAKLVVSDASQISVASSGQGNSGDISINASESIELSGFAGNFRGGLIASAVNSGNGGNINLTTGELSISDGATIVAGNTPSFAENSIFATGTGQPGNINIQTNSINLDIEGRIEAATQSEIGEGANIDLQVTKDITLRNNSFISARAFNNADGGNLDIDARFVVAFPGSGTGNDLVATAEAGSGGNISLDVERIFGLQPRNAIDGENNFLVNNSNDIDVSGNVAGNITINTNDVDPIRGTTELPSDIVVPESTTQQACEANRESAAKNGLNINGKGGIIPDPALPLNSLNVSVDGKNDPTTIIPAPIKTAKGKIQPARGIRVAKSGDIILTAYRTDNTGERIVEGSRNCGGT